ncbi:MAG: helix-turn-helix domain-containing protein, partial [Eubacterium sp.]|nr:helix-turn-helix domain-containing protein [Eubacterium sp.]
MKDKAVERTDVAERLIELRESRGLSPQDVCAATGIKYENYRKYETSTFPKKETYIILADFFGVSIDYLMGRTKKPNSQVKITYSEKENDDSFI